MQFIKINPNHNQNQGTGHTQAGNPNKQTNSEGEAGKGNQDTGRDQEPGTKKTKDAQKCNRITYKTSQRMMRCP